MFNKIKKIVMGFVSNNTIVGNQPVNSEEKITQNDNNQIELDLYEIEYLLKILGNADLKGNQVEMFYNMVMKLQNFYLQKSKK